MMSRLSVCPQREAWEACYAPPRDRLRLATNDRRIFALADRLWTPRSDDDAFGPIAIRIDVQPSPTEEEGAEERWWVTSREARVSLGPHLSAIVNFPRFEVRCSVTAGFLDAHPTTAARLLLEAPVAELLARRTWYVIHGGAIVGSHGAVVVRGPSGSGKSTLIAAAWQAGFDVLGDESLLVARADPDELSSTVREIAVNLESASPFPFAATKPAFRDRKHRVDLLSESTPDRRLARRVATVLLGDRSPGPARLIPLVGSAFRDAFRQGEIEQERWAGDPDGVAAAWSASACFRLVGTTDIAGAVAAIGTLAGLAG